jgi:hypothetical protein
MTRKYTPGPWRAVYVPIKHVWEIRGLDGNAVVTSVSAHPGSDEDKANAELIALAPVLLEFFFERHPAVQDVEEVKKILAEAGE